MKITIDAVNKDSAKSARSYNTNFDGPVHRNQGADDAVIAIG
jgi:hypothetical protein